MAEKNQRPSTRGGSGKPPGNVKPRKDRLSHDSARDDVFTQLSATIVNDTTSDITLKTLNDNLIKLTTALLQLKDDTHASTTDHDAKFDRLEQKINTMHSDIFKKFENFLANTSFV